MSTQPTAVVMNMFYTGLGIARSLGSRDIRVIGLSARPGVYGNFTRFAKVVRSADSAADPDALLSQLMALGRTLSARGVLFPTRDHDLVFLDRFRAELAPYYSLVIPSKEALAHCLNKWETYQHAVAAGVPAPKSWLVHDAPSFQSALAQVTFPCVLKPLEAHHWRTAGKWDLVGGRKAFSLASREELLAEYTTIAQADQRMLIQELIPGADESLFIAAAYIDRSGRLAGAFNIQKVVQIPEGFGTGCIVRSVRKSELFEPTVRLLAEMGFTGIAEVEYKRDKNTGQYKLIEVNPRPWDQHRLGAAGGVDLMHLAYCDHAGLPSPDVCADDTPRKWIAEDAFLMAAVRLAWRGERGLVALFQQAKGTRIYGIWSMSDPLPFAVHMVFLLSALVRTAFDRLPWPRLNGREKTMLRASR